ncbi:MAG: AGE family epimerase/isomerase [Bacteroidetes bacterium]|nr:AGE family epimerase/isomerase [Bacteroidota bacterium]
MRINLLARLVIISILLASCKKTHVTPVQTGIDTTGNQGGNPPPVTSIYLNNAKSTHSYIANFYLTAYGSYRVNTTTNTTGAFEWYNASQLYADAAMVANGDQSYLPYVNNTFNWLQNLWDKNDPNGGYFAAANLDGSGAAGDKYVDDNSLTGVAFLAAYDVSSGTAQAKYLTAAEACANWLIKSGLWDANFGGGFWWSTQKTVKPTQSNGMALQLFLRLYQLTGNSVYHDWAVQVNTWLNGRMLDNGTGLYFWQIESNGNADTYKFTYDNAIMVEADLLWAKAMNDNTYVGKAEALAQSMIKTLYNANYNGFIFNTNDIRVNPCYCGWASQSFIRLYEADGNSTWLTYAKANIDLVNVVLENKANSGYYQYAGLNGAGRYTNMEGVDQAWMQRVQVLLSKYK